MNWPWACVIMTGIIFISLILIVMSVASIEVSKSKIVKNDRTDA